MASVELIILSASVAACVVIATVFAGLAMAGKGVVKGDILAAVFLVSGVSIATKSWFAAAVAVFVIATTITDGEFLLNLAAILRGGKEFFHYRRVSMSEEEILRKVSKDVSKAEGPTTSKEVTTTDEDKKSGETILQRVAASTTTAMRVEYEAVRWLSDQFEMDFAHGVKSINSLVEPRHVEIDALYKGSHRLVACEIKFIGNIENARPHIQSADRACRALKGHLPEHAEIWALFVASNEDLRERVHSLGRELLPAWVKVITTTQDQLRKSV